MKKTFTVLFAMAALVSLLTFLSATPAGKPAQEMPKTLKVGIYENRAIAIAYAHSHFHKAAMKEVVAEMEVAKKAKDKPKIKEIEQRMEWRQKLFHLKGFGHYPVQDMLKPIQDQLPRVAREMGVDVITWEIDYHGAQVEVVDITMALVKCYKPNKRARGFINQIKGKKPIAMRTLLKHKCGK